MNYLVSHAFQLLVAWALLPWVVAAYSINTYCPPEHFLAIEANPRVPETGPPPFRLPLIGLPPTRLPPTGLPPFGLRLKSFGLRLKSFRLPPFGLSHAD